MPEFSLAKKPGESIIKAYGKKHEGIEAVTTKTAAGETGRRLARIVLAGAWCCYIACGVFLCTFLRRGRSAVLCAAHWTKRWAAGTAALIGMKIDVIGDPGAAAGKLVVSNHTGYLDVLAEGALFPVRFAPQAEMRRWPFFGPFTALSRPVWVDRKNRSRSKETAREIAETLEMKLAMLVYPEGTSTDGRHGLLPFKSTAFEAAIEAGADLLPVLVFHEPAGGEAFDAAWHGNAAFLPHVKGVLGLKGIRTCVYIMPELSPRAGEDRKELAARMHREMSDHYEKCLSDFLSRRGGERKAPAADCVEK